MADIDFTHAKGKFNAQRAQAKKRGIAFELSFTEWLSLWENSGKYQVRGQGRGKYVMARNGDTGPYAIGNVRIITNTENVKEGWENERAAGKLRYPQQAATADALEFALANPGITQSTVAAQFGVHRITLTRAIGRLRSICPCCGQVVRNKTPNKP